MSFKKLSKLLVLSSVLIPSLSFAVCNSNLETGEEEPDGCGNTSASSLEELAAEYRSQEEDNSAVDVVEPVGETAGTTTWRATYDVATPPAASVKKTMTAILGLNVQLPPTN